MLRQTRAFHDHQRLLCRMLIRSSKQSRRLGLCDLRRPPAISLLWRAEELAIDTKGYFKEMKHNSLTNQFMKWNTINPNDIQWPFVATYIMFPPFFPLAAARGIREVSRRSLHLSTKSSIQREPKLDTKWQIWQLSPKNGPTVGFKSWSNLSLWAMLRWVQAGRVTIYGSDTHWVASSESRVLGEGKPLDWWFQEVSLATVCVYIYIYVYIYVYI